MAFKMNRPFKMNGPLKRSTTIKIGAKKGIGNIDTDVDSGSTAMFYNSKMGPMKMTSPSALKQAETDLETGSDLKEGDYAMYGQQAYDYKGNKIDFDGHEFTGEVIIDQNGRPYSEQEDGGTDELIFWAPKATDENFRGGEEKSERDKFNDQENEMEME
tara:strand:+ start:630 stop:1106 length:477 start_codon:yes stop_codon:yes gene_type:complete